MAKSYYTDEFKQEVVRQVIEEGHTVLEVSKSTGVSDCSICT